MRVSEFERLIESSVSGLHRLKSKDVVSYELGSLGCRGFFCAISLAAEGVVLYLMPIYRFPELEAEFGPVLEPWRVKKGCYRFRSAEDVPEDAIRALLQKGARRSASDATFSRECS